MSTYTDAHRQYYLDHRETICAKSRLSGSAWSRTPKGRYSHQKRKAKKRDIPWELTFEQWWGIWQASGKWDERAQQGYVMCRNGDTGPYSVDNVRIDLASSNALENYRTLGVDERGRIKPRQS